MAVKKTRCPVCGELGWKRSRVRIADGSFNRLYAHPVKDGRRESYCIANEPDRRRQMSKLKEPLYDSKKVRVELASSLVSRLWDAEKMILHAISQEVAFAGEASAHDLNELVSRFEDLHERVGSFLKAAKEL